ncbi:MAG: PDZ domain-containing protein [Candidatus Obscuribacterales bacterium]|nr:PDZ domain-containing protein [Candidatus Obscuribacterales bacterium]
MKHIRTLSLALCLSLSAFGAAIAEEQQGKSPPVPPLMDHIRDHGETLMPVERPRNEPGSDQKFVPGDGDAKDTENNGVAPGPQVKDISELPPEVRRMLGLREPQETMVEPTPAMREQLYKQIWTQIGAEYVDDTKLKDWEARLTKYDGKLNSAEELDAALTELVDSVGDRWTKYQSPTSIREFSAMVKDGFVLAGMVLRKHSDGAWHIDSMLYDSAAQKSVLREGDVVVSINGIKLENLSETEVLKLSAGHEGEVMKVVAGWDGQLHEVQLTLFRPMKDRVQVAKLPDDVLYIRLPTYEKPEIVDDFMKQLKAQYYEAKGGLTGIVLDLRNNSGGLVDMALKTTSLFLEQGTMVKSTVHKGQLETVTEYRVKPLVPFAKRMMTEPHMLDFFNWLQNTPMVILINGSTASSSEITTGALQDNGRVFVIGTHSFGKAVAFTIQDLPNGGRFFLTSMKYLTPNGHDVYDRGIQPDLVVEQPRDAKSDAQLLAAHDYIVKLSAQRFKQVQDGKDIAGKPAKELKHLDANPYKKPLILLGFLIGLLILAFTQLASHKKK